MKDRELLELASRSRRMRRLPADASCEICKSTEHLSRLAGGAIRCYSHLQSSAGRVELDHWLGRGASIEAVIPLEANSHRRITDLRRLIGFDDLPPADGEPLLLLARLLKAVASLLALVAEWLVDHVTAMRAGVSSPPFPVSSP
ncbi:MAG: hypothetical protein M3406_13245 [Chloroflexota bacterium]|nr:hypothetical protein [Chloroflexota bacterium]